MDTLRAVQKQNERGEQNHLALFFVGLFQCDLRRRIHTAPSAANNAKAPVRSLPFTPRGENAQPADADAWPMAVHVEVAVSQFDEPLDCALTSMVTVGNAALMAAMHSSTVPL